MLRISQYATRQAQSIASHPLFAAMENSDLAAFQALAPKLVFLSFTWQEILRINAERSSSAAAREICEHAREDEKGHDRWIMHDVSVLCPSLKTDIVWLFNQEQALVRDACYDLLSEVITDIADVDRITVMLAVESASKMFFSTLVPILARKGWTERLAYYTQKHLDSEYEHAIYDEDFERQMKDLPLSSQAYDRCIALVDRVHDRLQVNFDAAAAAVDRVLEAAVATN